MLKRRKRMEEYRQKSFIPLPPIWENDCVYVIRDKPSYGKPPSIHTSDNSCIQDIFRTFFQFITLLNSEFRNTKCLSKALPVYVVLTYLNVIRSDYSTVIKFAIYYPTIVGWLYIFTKGRMMYDNIFITYSLVKTNSNQTLSTVSSEEDIPSSDHSDCQTNEMKESLSDYKSAVSFSSTEKKAFFKTNGTRRKNPRKSEMLFDLDDDYGHFVTFSDEDQCCQEILNSKVKPD